MPRADERFLRSGDVVRAGSEQAVGRLGLLAVDSNGQSVAICARHILSGGLHGMVLGPHGRVLGVVRPMDAAEDGPRAAIEALGTFEIDKSVLIDAAVLDFDEPGEEIDPDELLGAAVIKLDPRGGQRGVVQSIDGTLRLLHPPDPAARLHGVVEIRAVDPISFAKVGDAGALILSPAGRPVVLLLAERDGRFFGVTLRDFLRGASLRVMTQADAESHNREAREAVFSLERLQIELESVLEAFESEGRGKDSLLDHITAAVVSFPSSADPQSALVAGMEDLRS